MNKRRALLTVTALALLLSVSVAYASYATSIIYSKFNSTDWTDYELDQDYMSATIDIKNALTYNVTGTWAKIAFTNQSTANDSTSDPQGIIIIFSDDDKTFKVYYMLGMSEVQIGNGTYTNPASGGSTLSTTRVILSGNKVTVYANYGDKTNQAKAVDDFSFNEEFSVMRVKGTDLNTASDGYVQVNVNVGTAGTSTIINAWIPVIVTFALLSIVLGYLKKIGKF